MIGEAPELLAVAGSLYDAALDPALWVPALRQVARSLDVWGMTLLVVDAAGREVLFRAAYNEPPDAPPLGSPRRGAPEAPLSAGAALPRLSAVWRHTIQRRWPEEAGEAPCRLVIQLWLPPPEDSAARADGVPASQAEVLARWRTVEPHLRRAVQISRRLRDLEHRSLLADTVDALSCGMFLLDAAGQVRHRNPAAEAHLARGDGLLVTSGGVLTGQRRSDRSALSGLLARAVAWPAAAGSMALARPRTPHPYILHAVPLGVKRGPTPHGRPAAALLVSDSDLGAAVPRADLRRLFGLTEREAALAAGIVQGQRLNAVADQLGLSVRTARNYLQAVFRKTGTRRQGELIALANACTLCRLP